MYIDVYKVQSGDTFTNIAEKLESLESRSLEIATINGLKHDQALVNGQLLKIVKKGIYDSKKHLYINRDEPKGSSLY